MDEWRPWHIRYHISCLVFALWGRGNKSRSWDKNLRKFNSLTSNFLPLPPHQWVPCCSPPLHLWPNMARSLSWCCGQIWRKGQFFSPAMAVFQPIGSLLYMARACAGGIVIVHSWDLHLMKTMIILITIMPETLILSDAYRGSPPYRASQKKLSFRICW